MSSLNYKLEATLCIIIRANIVEKKDSTLVNCFSVFERKLYQSIKNALKIQIGLPIRMPLLKLCIKKLHLTFFFHVTLIYFLETVVHCRNTTCITVTETSTCINTIKSVSHIFDAENVTCISDAETSN